MFAAELLAEYDKMIDAVQVAAVLQRIGESADVGWVHAELNELAEEHPPRLNRRARRVTTDGADQLMIYFVLPR